ncbi:MAG: hypothetical protein WD691_09800 [Acidimicrobiales bacterium]
MTAFSKRRRRGVAAVTVAASITLAGCADRELLTAPRTTPGGGTWVAVWAALLLATLTIGVLLTLPTWRVWRGARLAVSVFTLEAGAVVVAGVMLASIAGRSWQILGRPGGAPPDDALLRLGGADGDRAFFAIMFLSAAVLAVVLGALAAAGARLAGSTDPVKRAVASAVLAAQAGGAAYAIVRLVLGADGLPYVIPALAFPFLVVAFATCWPRVPNPEYNSGHG